MSRRLFLLSTAALPVACAGTRAVPLRSATRTVAPVPAVRPPAVGQSWRYAKHDGFTGSLLQTQIDEVVSLGRTVEIQSRTEADEPHPATGVGGMNWMRQYFDHPRLAGPLPSEVQDPWGMVRVDPHWRQIQVYDRPIPLWPSRLEPGWQTRIRSTYRTSDEAGLSWEQTMKAEAWQSLDVPAGRFTALRYINVINFTSSDFSRSHSVRRETLWFAPEVGRWVARESRGSYDIDESVADDPYNENSYRWELLSFI